MTPNTISSSSNLTALCQDCPDDPPAAATQYCYTKAILLCDACSTRVHTGRSSRNHDVVLLSEEEKRIFASFNDEPDEDHKEEAEKEKDPVIGESAAKECSPLAKGRAGVCETHRHPYTTVAASKEGCPSRYFCPRGLRTDALMSADQVMPLEQFFDQYMRGQLFRAVSNLKSYENRISNLYNQVQEEENRSRLKATQLVKSLRKVQEKMDQKRKELNEQIQSKLDPELNLFEEYKTQCQNLNQELRRIESDMNSLQSKKAIPSSSYVLVTQSQQSLDNLETTRHQIENDLDPSRPCSHVKNLRIDSDSLQKSIERFGIGTSEYAIESTLIEGLPEQVLLNQDFTLSFTLRSIDEDVVTNKYKVETFISKRIHGINAIPSQHGNNSYFAPIPGLKTPGTYDMSLSIDGEIFPNVRSFDVQENVLPSECFLITSLKDKLEKGSTTTLSVQAVDRNGNKLSTGGLFFQAHASSADDASDGYDCPVQDKDDGTYTVFIEARRFGSLTISIHVGGQEIKGGPFRTEVCDVCEAESITINTGVARSYVSNWGIWHALREQCQNWRDALGIDNVTEAERKGNVHENGETYDYWVSGERKGRIEYTRSGDGQLVFTTFRETLPRSAIAMGGTSKKDDQKSAGKFGEGLKLSALVLVRNEKSCVIETDEDVWTFYMETDPVLQKDMLKVDITRANRKINEVKVTIDHISESEWNEMKDRFIPLWESLDQYYTCRSEDNKGYVGGIIIDPQRKGQMFCKGIYVTNNNMDCSYDFEKISLNRDREIFANQSEINSNMSTMWQILPQDPSKVDQLMPLLYELLSKGTPDIHNLPNNISHLNEGLKKIFLTKNSHQANPFPTSGGIPATLYRFWNSNSTPIQVNGYLYSKLKDTADWPTREKMEAVAKKAPRTPAGPSPEMSNWRRRLGPILSSAGISDEKLDKVRIVSFPHDYLNWEKRDKEVLISYKFFQKREQELILLGLFLNLLGGKGVSHPSHRNY